MYKSLVTAASTGVPLVANHDIPGSYSSLLTHLEYVEAAK